MKNIVINESPVDQFTLAHGAAGVLARRMGLSFASTLALGFIWDYAVEPELKHSNPQWFPYPSQDSANHAFIDALTPAVAWLLYDAYLKRGIQ